MTQTISRLALRTEAIDPPEPSSGLGGPQLPDHPPSPSFEHPTSVRHASSHLASLDSEESSVRESVKREPISKRLKRALSLQKETWRDSTGDFTYKYKVEPLIPTLDQHPVGYGKLAAFEGCDPDLLIYRKFTWLRNCSLLYLQDELVELEEDLIALDKHEFIKEPRRLFSRRQNEGPDEIERRELLAKIQAKLIEYDESLFRMQKIQAMKRPTKRNQNSVSAFIANTGSQAAEESDWIRLSPDLAAVAHDQEHGWLIAFLENTLLKISRKITVIVFRTSEQRIVSGEEPINLVSAARLDILLRSILTICASVLLLTPIFVLFRLQPRNRAEVDRNTYFQIMVIFFFTLAFSALCSIFTKAKRQEVFAATAAYSAVLVVFLGNSGSLVMSSSA